jgi:hypothetical protein
VKDHSGDITAAGDGGHVQRRDDQISVVMCADREAKDPPRVQVNGGDL